MAVLEAVFRQKVAKNNSGSGAALPRTPGL
jgi:hypothetical protein